MKRFLNAFVSLLMFGAFAGMASQGLEVATGLNANIGLLIISAMVFVHTTYKQYNGDVGAHIEMGIQKEIWQKYILGAIFKDNQFITFAYNADEYVMQGKVVHIPQAGSTAAVVKNRSSLPATVTKRTDTDITYPLDEFTTDPRLIPNADTVELSYDKMESVMSDDMNALRQTVAENCLIAWAPATNIIRTTGGNVVAHTPSATGNRKIFLLADLRAAMTRFNKDNVPMQDRYAAIDSEMYDQMIAQMSESQYRDFLRAFDEKTGVVGMLYSFKIVMRSTVLVYDNTGTPVVKAYGAAGAATDNAAVLCWQKNAVERAIGDVLTFNKDNDPQYYGDLFSFLLRGGFRIRRTDENGVLAIVQAAGA